MADKHLERRGFEPNKEKLTTPNPAKKGEHRIAGAITGRRARKEWPCAAEDCDLPEIEWDEVYVEATDPAAFAGRHLVKPPKRFHLSCAIRHELIVKVKTEQTNRRGAIAMTKARMG